MQVKYAVSLLLLLISNTLLAAGDELVFSTAPTHPIRETERIYKPLVDYLSQATGKKVVLDPASNFVEYQIRMRLKKYDILFDGPHLVGWRMDNIGHLPLARLPGEIKIVVATTENSKLQSMEEIGMGQARVCAFNSPNMLTMAFLSYFPNPTHQPVMLRVQGFNELEQCLRSGRGDVAVFRDTLWKKMDQSGLRLISAPERAYPERTFSVSSNVDAATQEKLRLALLSDEGKKAAAQVLEKFKKQAIIPAEAKEYEGLGSLLSPVWGFHR